MLKILPLRLINFTFDSSIELGFGGRERWLDLHNCFDWRSLDYVSEKRCIKLTWLRASGEWIESSLPEIIEDSCLAFVTFTPPEFSSDFECEFGGYRNEAEHLTLRFQSSFGLKIWAEEAELILPVCGEESAVARG